MFRHVVAALRVHQWIKNVLVFVPLILAHQIADLQRWLLAIAAFFAFSLAASSAYIINDLRDIDADRLHPRKRHRPFASGALAPRFGVGLAAGIMLSAVGVGIVTLPAACVALLLGYLGTTLLYSLVLKHVPIVDVLVLAGLYTLRLGAGALAVDVSLSPWLATFAMFLFLSLAFVKRYAEMAALRAAKGAAGQARGYRADDIFMLDTLGPASGYMSVLVLALYLNSEAVTLLYARPFALWFLLPLLLYWMSRLWFRANRGELHDDPIVDTATDPVSYVVLLLVATVVVVAAA